MVTHADFRFSTDAVPVRDRLAVWREVIGREYMCLDIEPDGSSPLQASLTVYQRSSTQITLLQASPMRYTRTRAHAAKADGDFTFVQSSGGFTFSGEGEDAGFSSGDAAVLPNSRTGTIAVAHRDPCMTIRINGAMLRAAVRDIDERLVNRLHADNAPLRLAGGYLDCVLRSGAVDPALGHRVHGHIVDLLALGLRPGAEAAERAQAGAVPSARLATIRAHVVTHLGDALLSARRIAQRHGISQRYVHLLFEQNGMSFHRFVTEERLKRSMTMLLDPALAQLRISDVAFAVGFGDLTTFNRAFRRRFGDTPSAVRATAASSRRD